MTEEVVFGKEQILGAGVLFGGSDLPHRIGRGEGAPAPKVRLALRAFVRFPSK